MLVFFRTAGSSAVGFPPLERQKSILEQVQNIYLANDGSRLISAVIDELQKNPDPIVRKSLYDFYFAGLENGIFVPKGKDPALGGFGNNGSLELILMQTAMPNRSTVYSFTAYVPANLPRPDNIRLMRRGSPKIEFDTAGIAPKVDPGGGWMYFGAGFNKSPTWGIYDLYVTNKAYGERKITFVLTPNFRSEFFPEFLGDSMQAIPSAQEIQFSWDTKKIFLGHWKNKIPMTKYALISIVNPMNALAVRTMGPLSDKQLAIGTTRAPNNLAPGDYQVYFTINQKLFLPDLVLSRELRNISIIRIE